MTSTMRDDTAIIAYDASVRAVSSQETQLAALHTRASFILGAAGIATGTVLGRGASNLHGFGLVAVVAFAAAAVFSTIILAPRRDAWRFTSNAKTIIQAGTENPRLTTTQIREWLATTNQSNYESDKTRLDSLYNLLTGACASLAVAIAAAIISLAF